MPVARRVLGESNAITLGMRRNYAQTLCTDPSATLDDVREAVTILEDTGRTARRVLGSAHPLTTAIEDHLRNARAALRAREPVPPEKLCFDPAVGFTGPPVNFPRGGEEQAERPSF